MTKKQLIINAETLESYYADKRRYRLNHCNAVYAISNAAGTAVLYSYGTLCAVCWRGIVWEFDRWSNTTTQHVRKFARLMGAPVVSLYRVSGMSKRDYERHSACDWKDVIAAATENL